MPPTSAHRTSSAWSPCGGPGRTTFSIPAIQADTVPYEATRTVADHDLPRTRGKRGVGGKKLDSGKTQRLGIHRRLRAGRGGGHGDPLRHETRGATSADD